MLAGLEDLVHAEDKAQHVAVAAGERDLLNSGDEVLDQSHGHLRAVASPAPGMLPGLGDDQARALLGQRLHQDAADGVDAQLPVWAAVDAAVAALRVSE